MLVLLASAICWLVTKIVVEAEIFNEPRDWITLHAPEKIGYLVHCYLCSGVWIGWGVALLIPGPFSNWFLNGLAYKAVAHLILTVENLMERLPSGPMEWTTIESEPTPDPVPTSITL